MAIFNGKVLVITRDGPDHGHKCLGSRLYKTHPCPWCPWISPVVGMWSISASACDLQAVSLVIRQRLSHRLHGWYISHYLPTFGWFWCLHIFHTWSIWVCYWSPHWKSWFAPFFCFRWWSSMVNWPKNDHLTARPQEGWYYWPIGGRGSHCFLMIHASWSIMIYL